MQSGRRLRILCITPGVPFAGGGFARGMMRGDLVALSHIGEVSLASLVIHPRGFSELDALRPMCRNVVGWTPPNLKTFLHRLYYKGVFGALSLMEGYPVDLYYTRWGGFRDILRKLPRVDVVYVGYRHMACYLPVLDARFKVIRDGGARFSQALQMAEQARCLRNWYLRWIARRLMDSQVLLLNYGDYVVVPSHVDKHNLLSLGRKLPPVDDFPGFFNVEGITPCYEAEEEHSMFYLGSMSFPPNVDAVVYLAKCIFPLIKRQVPDVKLWIIGHSPASDVQRLHNGKDIIVTGFVEDVGEYISRFAVGVFPLRFGVGVKGKIIETTAYGKPVVTTKMGITGMSYVPGEDLLVGDTPEEIAEHTVKLLVDRRFRYHIAVNGRHRAMADYSISRGIEEWRRVIKANL